MKILSEVNQPYDVTAINEKMPMSHYWILDARDLDFRLAALEFLEETTGPTITMRIENQELTFPANWFAVVVDTDTYQIDSVPIAMLATNNYDLLMFSPHDSKVRVAKPIFLDVGQGVVTYAACPKGASQVVPVCMLKNRDILEWYGVMIGQYDLGRWIEGKSVGDIFT